MIQDHKSYSIMIQFNMQNLIVADSDACVTSLMVLVAILPSDVFYISIVVNFYLIDITDSEPMALKPLIS